MSSRRTTVHVGVGLHQRFAARCSDLGVSMREMLERLLEYWLASHGLDDMYLPIDRAGAQRPRQPGPRAKVVQSTELDPWTRPAFWEPAGGNSAEQRRRTTKDLERLRAQYRRMDPHSTKGRAVLAEMHRAEEQLGLSPTRSGEEARHQQAIRDYRS